MIVVDLKFWKEKKVLVTGHTGFMGSWLSIWLLKMGAEVIGYSLDPETDKDNFSLSGISEKMEDIRGDIRDREKLLSVFRKYEPEVVFHLAAQPLVRYSFHNPVDTYQVNVMGTINVLEGIREVSSLKTGILFTTDKCYEKRDQIWGYRENEPLGGYDPYSSSKAAAEVAINSWRNSFFNPKDFHKHGKAIASIRSGNVIGGGDWAADRILPDCIRAIESERDIEIRSPKSVLSCEHVLEPLGGALLLAQSLLINPVDFASGWNFGPGKDSIVSVWELASKVVSCMEKGHLKDVSDLTAHSPIIRQALDTSKAQFLLGWNPSFNVDKAIELTADWYLNYREKSVYEICLSHIDEFIMNERC